MMFKKICGAGNFSSHADNFCRVFSPRKRGRRAGGNPGFSLSFIALCFALGAASIGCQTARPIPKADLSAPGWNIRQGEAIWKPDRQKPELAGDLLLATRPDGRVLVQFSKTPFPVVVAQKTSHMWEIRVPIQNKRYSGHGKPPRRLIWLYLPGILAGHAPPKGWHFKRLENDRWRLANPSTGETVEGYLSP
ncbi:MAG TPA: hypothetical protein VHH88_10025 [Verrucomicrobiae bacterium]|nr:hypothetical protein [Verrucomicrobiae bacterium]